MSDDRQPSADAADFAALGAQLGRLRRLPVPPGLEARLLAAMPVGSRPGRPRLLRWAAWLTGTAAACLLVGVLSWQAGRNDRPAIVADHSRPSMAVRGPATRPASDNLGVQLAYHRTSDDLPGSQRNVGSNSFGRFGEEGRGGDVSITNARGGFAANTAGHFASTQPDGAIPLAGGKRGTPQGGGWAQSMEQNNTYFDGVDLPPDISSPARLGEAESNHRNRPDVGGRERSGLFSNKGQSRRAEPGDGPSAATGPAAVNDGEHTIAQIHPFGRKTAIPAAAVNHEDGLKQIEKPVPPATIESAEPGPLVPSRNLADGLIGHCPADGEANDDVGNHHGTFHGGVDYAPGKLAQAWRFNGKDGRIALANPTKADKDAFTISAWVKVAAAGAHQVVLSKWYLDGREGQSYCLGITPAMCPELALGPNGAGVVYITSPDAVTADKWHHLAATWNGKEARLYLDGASKGSLAIPSGLRASEAPWSVGAHDGAAGGSFHGLIDELSIWNRALSEEEVRALQTPRPFGRNPLAEGLVGLWTGEGNANDTVGRNHGTVRGKVTFVPGKVGQAFQVSGRDGYVDLGNPPALQLTGNMTTAMWVNPSRLDDLCCLLVRTQNRDSIHMTADGALHYCYGRNGDPRWEHIDLGSDGKTLHYIENNPPVVLKAQNPGRVLHVGEWTHVAIVRDLESHTLRWYFDGALVAEGPAPISAPSITGASLGLGFSPGAPGAGFSGLVDDVAIWNRALSAEEVLAACEARSPLEVFAGPVIVTREAQTDRIVLGEADVLKGSILNESYEITTVFGKLTVPASRVAGLAPAGGSGSWLVLADGQRLLGPLAEPALRIKLSVGATLSIPLARIRQAGYRLPDRPAEPATLPLAILRDGQRVLVSEISPALTLRTDCGEVAMAPRGLRSLEPAPAPAPPGAHRATFLNGSTLTGRIGPDKFNLTLALGVRAFVEREQFQGLLSPGGPSQLAPEAATLLLRNGDKLIGLVEDANLTVAHEFGPVAFPPGAAKALTFAPAGGAAVAVELWDGSRLTGRLTDPAVTFTVSGFGPTVKAPAAQIAAITRAVALPPPEVLDKVEGLIRQLGSGTAAAREAATRALAGMGKGIAPILRRYGADPDPEIAQRIQIILTDLGATPGEDQPPTPEAPRP